MSWTALRTIEKAGDGRVPAEGDLVSLHIRLWAKSGTAPTGDPIVDTYVLAQPLRAVIGNNSLLPDFEALLLDVPVGTTFWIEIPIPGRLQSIGLGEGAVIEVHVADVRPSEDMMPAPPSVQHRFGPCRALDDLDRAIKLKTAISRLRDDGRGFASGAISKFDFDEIADLSNVLGLQIEAPQFTDQTGMIRMHAVDVKNISDLLSEAIKHLEGL